MSFKPITEQEFKSFHAKKRAYKVEGDIADFLTIEALYGQIDITGYKSVDSVCTTYFNAISRMGLSNQVRVCRKGGNAFLVKVARIGDEA